MKTTTNHALSRKIIIKTFCKLLNGNILYGKSIEKFENQFKEFIGVKHSIATSSGRYALYVILKSLKIDKGVDEIIVPALMPTVVAKVIELCGLKLVFADVDPTTLTIDPQDIEKKITKNTKFLLIVHLHGIPCDMEKIMQIVRKNNLFLIEDCAQAIGSCYDGKKVGSFGDASIYSLGVYKTLTTFGGGMVLTDNTILYKKIKTKIDKLSFPKKTTIIKQISKDILTWFLLTPFVYTLFSFFVLKTLFKKHSFDYDYVDKLLCKKTQLSEIEHITEKNFNIKYGTKFTNLQASIGLESFKEYYTYIVTLQNQNFEKYNSQLKDPLSIPGRSSPVMFLYYTMVKDPWDMWIKLFNKGFLSPTNSYPSLPDLKMFNKYKNNCPVASSVRKKVLYLPFRSKLKEKDAIEISRIINEQYYTIKNKNILFSKSPSIKKQRDVKISLKEY